MQKLSTWLLFLAIVIGVVVIAYSLFTTAVYADFSYNEGTSTSVLPAGQYEVAFTGNAAGGFAPYNYIWSFGDGSGGAGQQVRHTYTLPGSYAVNLTVQDTAGHIVKVSKTIQVPSTPPPTSAAVYPAAPHVPTPSISLIVLGVAFVLGAMILYFVAPRHRLLAAAALIALVLVAAFYVVMYA